MFLQTNCLRADKLLIKNTATSNIRNYKDWLIFIDPKNFGKFPEHFSTSKLL
jgi:hypothetical protein